MGPTPRSYLPRNVSVSNIDVSTRLAPAIRLNTPHFELQNLTFQLDITMSSGSGLPPIQHAKFAVVSRLLSCLVTEQLLRALYIPIADSKQAAGALVILSTHLISEQPVISRPLRSNDIFAIVPLRQQPVFKGTSVYKHGRPVGLVDPLDMLPEVYELTETLNGEPLHVSRSPFNSNPIYPKMHICRTGRPAKRDFSFFGSASVGTRPFHDFDRDFRTCSPLE